MPAHRAHHQPTVAVLRLMIGCAASGKTEWCTHPSNALGVRLSLDEARARLGRHAHDQDASPAAVEAVQLEMASLLLDGQSVTLDATSTERTHRERWLGVARRYRAHPIAVVLRTPLELALVRNDRRERPVPRDVLKRMWQQVDLLTVESLHAEGFAEITEIGLATHTTERNRTC
ncbi:AAA family ATPase (plasmid) [Saccharothrix sp. AJ9571]|nr:AAA family ATPase [Saccharothrix sp. AJ9571]